MLKPKHTNLKSVIYMGLEVQVPEEAVFIFLHKAREQVHVAVSEKQPSFDNVTWQIPGKTLILAVDNTDISRSDVYNSIKLISELERPEPRMGSVGPKEEQFDLEAVLAPQLHALVVQLADSTNKVVTGEPGRFVDSMLNSKTGIIKTFVDGVNEITGEAQRLVAEAQGEADDSEECDCPACSGQEGTDLSELPEEIQQALLSTLFKAISR